MGTNDRSLAGTLLTWIVAAVVVVAGIKLAFWVLGIALGLGGLLLMILFRLLPLLLVGWLVLRLVRYFQKKNGGYESV